MIHDWQIRDGRLFGTVDRHTARRGGRSVPAAAGTGGLSSFEGAGLRVVKAPLDKANAYWLVAETAGRMTGKAVFEMPLADPAKGWELPDGPSAMRQVTVRWNQGGWEFHSPAAAKVEPLAGSESG